MTQSSWKQPFLIWCGWVLFALFLNFGPPSLFERIESLVLNSSGLSLKLVDSAQRWGQGSTGSNSSTELKTLSDDSAFISLKKQNRDLGALLATLQAENQQLKSIPDLAFDSTTTPLQIITGVQANVIGRQATEETNQNRLLISLGERHGLAGDELILEGEGLLIDQGDLANLTPDQLVTFGRSLYGRTVQVGRWTSLVQPITDPEFRTAVQLVRKSDFGLVTGASGILKGTGSGCEIIEVAGTEAVAVGDLIYTDTSVSPTATPIYCGRVIEATISPNAAQWTIIVSPATPQKSLPSELTVMKTELTIAVEPDAENQ